MPPDWGGAGTGGREGGGGMVVPGGGGPPAVVEPGGGPCMSSTLIGSRVQTGTAGLVCVGGISIISLASLASPRRG